MGEAMEIIEFPICNKFTPRIFSTGQICYSVDVNEFKDQIATEKLKNGLIFLVDHNKGKMLTEQKSMINLGNSSEVFDVLKQKKTWRIHDLHQYYRTIIHIWTGKLCHVIRKRIDGTEAFLQT
eukprot:TRINITY_DN34521_c0_g1_i1.p1 TRINITY_DN34521_c0_g1~~TRINITY_DN34521_c0_g1_i1.p1  ORF type:complete len:142 (+),score=12.31 TRINITY_DN34521_c0_g1_i1:59-427(+)